eukprot:CAMPEP_0119316336 /NCGR_PEP_ID=MMETSP1333-20130426/39418_1 /TAXON_ID=418940 /ORGANISM="Scyphosphaera apsteinii, Strain RCC1455" /LENGTH=363 /DNA_ID=CAMNT_0007321953 /DNA_START=31 /DNA_END=1122 /DNA_ORIENTATION=-
MKSGLITQATMKSGLISLPTLALMSLVAPLPAPLRSRVRQIHASLNDTLTVGDVLVGSLHSSISQLSKAEQAARAQRNLDALLTASSAEIDAIANDLVRDLQDIALNTSAHLHQSTLATEAAWNYVESKLDAAMAPTRDGVRAELKWHLEVQSSISMTRRRERARRRDFKRTSSWRDASALTRSAGKPKHPVVMVCEGSAIILTLMMFLVFTDFASSAHYLTSPPHIARVTLQHPRHTAELNAPTQLPMPDPAVSPPLLFSPPTRGAPVPTESRPSTPAAKIHNSARATWWRVMRWVLTVYFSSLGIIVLRSASGAEDWAALAIGSEPCSSAPRTSTAESGNAGSGGLVRYKYDWERDEWREG